MARRATCEWGERWYKPLAPSANVCSYCGAKADTVDHVPPIASLAKWGPEWFAKEGIPLVKYAACRECNFALHDRPLFTLSARCEFLANRLRERHHKLLAMPIWDEDDLDEVGYGIRSMVKSALEQRQFVLRRLAILEDYSALESKL